MFVRLLSLLLFVYKIYGDSTENEPIIKILNGRIRGKSLTNIFNRTYYAFLEIPYATPPVGDLRFQEAIFHNNWEGILNTTEDRKLCWEVSASHTKKLKNKPEENEDCLHLNVYVPKLPDSKNELIPVVAFVYGGQFAYGNDWMVNTDPQLLVDGGVIFVIFNFRSGPLGFLTTDDRVIPANLGLKDQNLALKWIQNNIECFGGDPKKVTLMGHSSGAISVAYHVLSRRSKGLFRSAIIQSATSIMPMAANFDSHHYAYQMGKRLSPEFTDKNSSHDLLRLLKSFSPSDICNVSMSSVPRTTFMSQQSHPIWGPVIENENDETAFVTGPMHDDFLNGNFNKIPVMMGITSEEILFYIKGMGIDTWMEGLDESPEALVFDDGYIQKKHWNEYGQKIKSIYTNGTFQEKPAAMYRLLSDSIFRVPIIRHADLASKFVDIHFYQYSYYGQKSIIRRFEHPVNVEGMGNVGHAEELYYIFLKGPDRLEREKQYPPEDILIRDRLVKLWTNFIKYTDPTPAQDPLLDNIYWPKFNYGNFTYLDIDKNFTLISGYPREYDKWLPIIEQYHQHPMATVS